MGAMTRYQVLRGTVMAEGRAYRPGESLSLPSGEGDFLCLGRRPVLAPSLTPNAPESISAQDAPPAPGPAGETPSAAVPDAALPPPSLGSAPPGKKPKAAKTPAKEPNP